jgi:hypothetical protein
VLLSEVVDSCLQESGASFSGEVLFDRIVMELWRRRALRCLDLDRRDFVRELTKRGWTYDARSHTWSKSPAKSRKPGDPVLFQAG